MLLANLTRVLASQTKIRRLNNGIRMRRRRARALTIVASENLFKPVRVSS